MPAGARHGRAYPVRAWLGHPWLSYARRRLAAHGNPRNRPMNEVPADHPFHGDDEWLARELEREEAERRLMQEHYTRVEKDRAAWTEKWPSYCRSCEGWGGSHFAYDPSPSGVALSSGHMWDFDPCEALGPHQCHRCRNYALTYEWEGPCRVCGWNFNDGMPPHE